MHTLQGCILLTVYRIQLFKQMSQIAHSRAYLWKKSRQTSSVYDCTVEDVEHIAAILLLS